MFDCSALVRRALGAFACVPLALGLLAATPSLAPPETVVVYPFHTGSGATSSAGNDLARELVEAINQAGGVNAQAGPVATERADYLKTAQAANAAFYITGYITPIASSVTVVAQLVSTHTGTIVWNNRAQVSGPTDVINEATIVRNAVLGYSSRGFELVGIRRGSPPPAPGASKPAAAAAPSNANAPVVASAPKPAATPARRTIPATVDNLGLGFPNGPQPEPPDPSFASVNNPSRFALIGFGGRSTEDARDYAASWMLESLVKHGQTAAMVDPDQARHALLRGDAICGLTGASYLLIGALNEKSTDATTGADMWTDATLDLTTYDCKAKNLMRQPKPVAASAFQWKTAVQHAVDATVTGYLLKLGNAPG